MVLPQPVHNRVGRHPKSTADGPETLARALQPGHLSGRRRRPSAALRRPCLGPGPPALVLRLTASSSWYAAQAMKVVRTSPNSS